MSQPDVLLFVPAVAPTENQTALRIAQSIAQAATRADPGRTPPGTRRRAPGPRSRPRRAGGAAPRPGPVPRRAVRPAQADPQQPPAGVPGVGVRVVRDLAGAADDGQVPSEVAQRQVADLPGLAPGPRAVVRILRPAAPRAPAPGRGRPARRPDRDAGRRPPSLPNLAAGDDRLGVRALLLEGFKVHGRYWAQDEPRHLEHLLGVWVPEGNSTVAGRSSLGHAAGPRALPRGRAPDRRPRAAAGRATGPTDVLEVVRHLTVRPARPDHGRGAERRPGRCGAGSARRTTRPSCATRSDQQRLIEHAGLCSGPAEDLALYRAEMAALARHRRPLRTGRSTTRGWVEANDACRRDILERLARRRTAAASELPDTCQVPWESSGWNNDRNVVMLLELMPRAARWRVAGRQGREPLWDLAERVYPDDPVPASRRPAGSATSGGCARSASPGPRSPYSRASRTTSARSASAAVVEGVRGSGGSTRARSTSRSRGGRAAVAVRPAGPRPQADGRDLRVRLLAGDVQAGRQAALGLLRAADPVRRPAGREARRHRRPKAGRAPGRRGPRGRAVRRRRPPPPSTREIEDLARWLGPRRVPGGVTVEPRILLDEERRLTRRRLASLDRRLRRGRGRLPRHQRRRRARPRGRHDRVRALPGRLRWCAQAREHLAEVDAALARLDAGTLRRLRAVRRADRRRRGSRPGRSPAPCMACAVGADRRFRTLAFRNMRRMAPWCTRRPARPPGRCWCWSCSRTAPGITADRLGERLGVSERAARRYVAHPARGGRPDRVDARPVRRVPRRPRAAAAAADVHRVRGARAGDGRARGTPRQPRDAADPVGERDRQDRPGAARAGGRARWRRSDGCRARGPDADASPAHRDHRGRSSRPARTGAGCGSATGSAATGAGDGGRPVGGRRPLRPLVPPVLVAHRRRPPGAPGGPGRRRSRSSTTTFTPPEELDPVDALEEHLSEGWRLRGRGGRRRTDRGRRRDGCAATSAGSSRSTTTTPAWSGRTDEPWWYAEHLAELRAPFHVVGPPELRDAVRDLGQLLLEAAGG